MATDPDVVPFMPAQKPAPQNRPARRSAKLQRAKGLKHRDKTYFALHALNTCVARPVGRKEMLSTPDAMAAMKKEWGNLIKGGVWTFSFVRERSEVIEEARTSNTLIHVGSLAGICVEKNSQLGKGNPLRKYKGRAVIRSRTRTVRRAYFRV